MKEDIKPKDGKRKLYFSLDMSKNYVQYTLDQNTTCESIMQEHKAQILSKISDVHGSSNINLNNYAFFLVDLKNVKKAQQNNLTKMKLNPIRKIFYFLQNPKTILCFLPKNPPATDLDNKNNANKIIIEENEKLAEIKSNYIKNEQIDNFYSNSSIYLYDHANKLFNKLKGNLSLKQMTIHGKIEMVIYIQDIRSILFCDRKNPMTEYLQVTSGDFPPYFIIITTNDNQFTIGLKSEEKLIKWRSGLDSVLSYYKTFTTDIDFKMNINNLKKKLLENEKEENQSKKSDISKIINKESLTKYADIYNKANNLIAQNNNEELKDVLKSNLFDDSLFYLNELYIIPTLNKFKEEFKELSQTYGKSNERKSIESLIAYYFMKSYQMTDEKSVLEL